MKFIPRQIAPLVSHADDIKLRFNDGRAATLGRE